MTQRNSPAATRRWHAARLAAEYARSHGVGKRIALEGDTSGAATQQAPWLTLRLLFEADADGGAPADLLAPLPAARLLAVERAIAETEDFDKFCANPPRDSEMS